MKKRTFFTEYAYICGIVTLAFGTAFMEKADLGVSMVVAPAYLLYLRLSEIWSFVTFGMTEYTFQALLLIVMILVLRRFRFSYLFSFVTAVIYGFTLDFSMTLVAMIDLKTLTWRILFYVTGMLLCSAGVSFMFNTYIAPEVYELFVKELAFEKKLNISKLKTTYDCISCLAAIVMSFTFFGIFHFEGVKIGTVICALINGKIIGLFSKRMEKRWYFKDKLPLRELFRK